MPILRNFEACYSRNYSSIRSVPLFTVVAVEQFKFPQDEPILKKMHASSSLRENENVLTRISECAGRSGPPWLACN